MSEEHEEPSKPQSISGEYNYVQPKEVDATEGMGTTEGAVVLYTNANNLHRIVLPEGATKAIAIRYLSQSIPLNEYQLPTFYYRSDFLPHNLELLTQEDADNCVVSLDYSDGYPTFGRSQIFWNQLPHEPFQDYLLFQKFIDQAEEVGLRQLQLLSM